MSSEMRSFSSNELVKQETTIEWYTRDSQGDCPDTTSRPQCKAALQRYVCFKTPVFLPHCFVPVVVINEADSLSRDAQAALRRTMEKYMSNMRIILCANSTGRLIAPIKSRCLLIRVAAPNTEEVHQASCPRVTSNCYF